MSARSILACILIAGGIAFFLLRSAPNPKPEAVPDIVQEPRTTAPETSPPVVIEEAQQPPAAANATNAPLASAYKMTAFIDHVLDSVPPERVATRNHLRGIQAVFFVSDYVMAAKTNGSLVLSESAIVAAFTNVTPDTSSIRDRLRLWAVRPGTLTDHYQSISEIPTEKENIKAIKAALQGGLINRLVTNEATAELL